MDYHQCGQLHIHKEWNHIQDDTKEMQYPLLGYCIPYLKTLMKNTGILAITSQLVTVARTSSNKNATTKKSIGVFM